MKQELGPKVVVVIVAVVVLVVVGIGYKVLFARPSEAEPVVKPGNERFMHPSGPDNPPPGMQGATGR